MMGM